MVKATTEHFRKMFGADPAMTFVAPGRVNLIGEHTDYNDGFVLPCAIDFHVAACISPAEDSELQVAAVAFPHDLAKIDLLASFDRDKTMKWSNYVRGVSRELQVNMRAGYEWRVYERTREHKHKNTNTNTTHIRRSGATSSRAPSWRWAVTCRKVAG